MGDIKMKKKSLAVSSNATGKTHEATAPNAIFLYNTEVTFNVTLISSRTLMIYY